MTLDEAIAEVNQYIADRGSRRRLWAPADLDGCWQWEADDFCSYHDSSPEAAACCEAFAVIANAVASGELVKPALADHGPTAPGQTDG